MTQSQKHSMPSPTPFLPAHQLDAPVLNHPASHHGDMVSHGSGICLVRFLAETEVWRDLQDHEWPCNHESLPLSPEEPSKDAAPSALANQPNQGVSGTSQFHPPEGVSLAVTLTAGNLQKT